MIVPAKYRELLGESFVVTLGLDGCLFVLPQDVWDEMEKKLMSLHMSSTNGRKVSRMFLSNALDCEFDKQGRILLPQNLRAYAGLQKDVVLVGVGNRAEIWDKDRWEQYNNLDDKEQMAADFEGLGF
jgi:MraZ protein